MNHLKFEVVEEKPKTKVFAVLSNDDEEQTLGHILWYAQWRQYIFAPSHKFSTFWAEDCLLEISNFLHKLKEERKQQKQKLGGGESE